MSELHKDYHQAMKGKILKKVSLNITVKAKINEHLRVAVGISSCSAKVLILRGENK